MTEEGCENEGHHACMRSANASLITILQGGSIVDKPYGAANCRGRTKLRSAGPLASIDSFDTL